MLLGLLPQQKVSSSMQRIQARACSQAVYLSSSPSVMVTSLCTVMLLATYLRVSCFPVVLQTAAVRDEHIRRCQQLLYIKRISFRKRLHSLLYQAGATASLSSLPLSHLHIPLLSCVCGRHLHSTCHIILLTGHAKAALKHVADHIVAWTVL